MLKGYFLKREFFIANRQEQIKQHYEVLKQIGRGAFGIAYLAKLKAFPHTLRVIKRISKKKVKNPISIFNEIRIMSILDHPHIIKIYETFQDTNNLFLVIDYCHGGQLYNRLSKSDFFNENQARFVFRQMVVAVRYLHQSKVAHRDLKLENFLMMNQNTWQLMLIDFGLSFHWIQDMKNQLKQSGEKKIVGTAYYIAPQIFTYEYDQRCDIWSLGVILYMLVTGAPPFDGENDAEIIQNIKIFNYSLNNSRCQSLTSHLKDLISRILQPVEHRIDLNSILNHSWFMLPQEELQKSLKIKFETVRNFQKFTKLKKVVSTYISTQLPQQQIHELGQLFQSIDVNMDGYIAIDQLKNYLQCHQGQNLTLKQLNLFLESVDTDHNGKINYNQFISSCLDESIICNEQYLKYAFKSFDLNRDGKIQRQQFSIILRSYNEQFSCNEQFIDELINENDKNRDGSIDYEEFVSSIKLVKKIQKRMSSFLYGENIVAE